MAFGQQPGPPATARQVQRLTTLVVEAGHTDLRDARGALGLNQRQAGGRFTRDEADDLIARLEEEVEGPAPGPAAKAPPASTDPREIERAKLLRKLPAESLASELQRRGWIVVAP